MFFIGSINTMIITITDQSPGNILTIFTDKKFIHIEHLRLQKRKCYSLNTLNETSDFIIQISTCMNNAQ
jgi:hypothetical protein